MYKTSFRIDMAGSPIQITHNPALVAELGWDAFIDAHPDGNFFQTRHCFDLFHKVPGYRPYLSAAIVDEKVAGILLSVTQRETAVYGPLTARNIVWGGPLVEKKNTGILDALLNDYNNTAGSSSIYSQFRNMFDCAWMKNSFERAGFHFHPHLNYLVLTTDESEDLLLKKMSKSKARQIRKGESNTVLREASNEDEVKQFYDLLKKLYREKVKKPLPPYAFFSHFYKDLVKEGRGKYLLVYLHDKLIGGIMSPILPGKVIYEWYIAGSDYDYKDCYPSVMATWAAIKTGHQLGCSHFDFLGAGKPDADYGVREFKAKFGGELKEFGRFEKIHKPILMKLGETGLKLYRKIKR